MFFYDNMRYIDSFDNEAINNEIDNLLFTELLILYQFILQQ